jgi:hypothetical protein
MSIGSCLAWPLALGAMIFAVRAVWEASATREAPTSPNAGRATTLMMTFCLMLLIGCTLLNMVALGSIRAASKATISAANLAGIGYAVKEYSERHSVYPLSLDSVIKEDGMSPKCFINPFDPEAPNYYPHARLLYSSYIYNPGIGKYVVDPEVIIAHEREAFDVCEPYIFAPKERWVLFGDLKVRHLTDAEFAEAMRNDEQRRQELGWPTSAGPAASQPLESPM